MHHDFKTIVINYRYSQVFLYRYQSTRHNLGLTKFLLGSNLLTVGQTQSKRRSEPNETCPNSHLQNQD